MTNSFSPKQEASQRYFDALEEISQYYSGEWLRRNSQKKYGLEFEEALEMAYENVRGIAKEAIRGRRRPKSPEPEYKEIAANIEG